MIIERSPYKGSDYYSPGWITKREMILNRDSHTCQHCGCEFNLIVHHKIYDNEKEIWDYNDNDLITLCRDCHKGVHFETIPNKEEIILMRIAFGNRIQFEASLIN